MIIALFTDSKDWIQTMQPYSYTYTLEEMSRHQGPVSI